jgi:hypothetical protein
MNNLKVVSELIEFYVSDIDDIDQKEYLKVAMTANITRHCELDGLDLPKQYVKEVVQAYFDGFSC